MAQKNHKGLAAGVKDSSCEHKPVANNVKKAKYGFHGKKDLSKTRIYE